MNKHLFALGLIAASTTAFAQRSKVDTLHFREIEDILLHKTGNPNKARPMSTKSALTVMETPQPIAVVTHEIIEQQQSRQLAEVLQNVNGIYVASSRGGSQDSFGGRGFNFGSDNIFKNGARINSGVFPEVSGLERVEVLKGGNAMLYGNVGPGGIVNMVTKKPRFNFGGSVGLNIGSWNTYKPTVDFYGPISKNVAFRVDGAYEYAESFRDVVQSVKHYFNPSFVFNIGANTQLIVEGDYLKNRFTPDFGIGAITNKDGSYSVNNLLDRSTFLGAAWQYQDVQQATADISLNHRFSSRWMLNAVASYQNFTRDYYATERVQWSYDNANRLKWDRPLNRSYNENNYTSLQMNLNGEFNTGRLNHKLLIGTDGDYGTSDSYAYNNPTKYGTKGSLTNATVYLDNPASWADGAMPDASRINRNRTPTQRFGIYAQDFVSITEQFKVLAGIRWNYIENKETIRTDFVKNLETRSGQTVDRAFSPKFGLVWMPNDNLSVFANYTNSFSANTGTTGDVTKINTAGTADQIKAQVDGLGRAGLKPSIIDQFELGLKKNLWSNAVAVNISAYQITNTNNYQSFWYTDSKGIIQTPDANLKVYAGKTRSRGAELDITGNPTPQVSIVAGASYNNTVYTDTPADGYVEGQRLVRTPATTANASVFYTFGNFAKGLKLGATVFYVGDRLAGWNDSKSSLQSRKGITRLMEVEDYVTAALSAGYEAPKFSIMAKVGNLFDKKAFNYHENYSVNPIMPRNFYVTLTYKL